MNLFSHAATKERDRALQDVAEHSGDWIDVALAALIDCVYGEKFTVENLKSRLLMRGLAEPHHHNAWGALMMRAQRVGLIEKTGEWTRSTAKQSHARNIPFYRRKAI